MIHFLDSCTSYKLFITMYFFFLFLISLNSIKNADVRPREHGVIVQKSAAATFAERVRRQGRHHQGAQW